MSEFRYFGDATVERPDPDHPDATQRFIEYVYVRRNPAGPHDELWHHVAGCRSWLIVTRHTVTHEILSVVRAADRRRGAAS